MVSKDAILDKLVAMFRPYGDGEFLSYPGAETIVGPNDRAMCGNDNNFPKAWLIEDFGFTPEEADWLIQAVHQRACRP